MQPTTRLLLVTTIAMLGACGSLPAARMALPESLASQPALALQGLGTGRSGEFTLAGERGRFERGADRLAVFEALTFDRVSARYSSDATRATCRGRQTEGTLGIVAGALRPFELQCRYEGAFAGELMLRGGSAAAGTQSTRSGRLVAASGATVEFASVHRLQGSPLPLSFPAGYVLSAEGRAIGAVELTDSQQPRVWLAPMPAPLEAAAKQAAITLALLWDPSQRVD